MNMFSDDRTKTESPDAFSRPHNSLFRRSFLLTQKELRETLRDRRTIITLLVMPLLLYPLMGMVFRFMAISQLRSDSRPEFSIVVGSESEAIWLNSVLKAGGQMLHQSVRNSGDETESSQERQRPRFRMMTPENPTASNISEIVRSLNADIGLKITSDSSDQRSTELAPSDVEVISCSDSQSSREALRSLEEILVAANLNFASSRLLYHDPAAHLPVRVTQTFVRSGEKSRGLLGMIPLILLLMTVTGGVYPAIDLTAGERERDTLETLISLPVPRVHLLLAKFVAVLSVTMLTGLVNLTAMTATVFALRMETQLFGAGGMTIRLAISLAGILAIFGLFYSSVLLAITSSSRSFKEAQTYLIPLMLMSLGPGLSVLMPGWHLEGIATVIPVVNMLLLAREVFERTATAGPALLAVTSTVIYAAIALWFAARVFGADAVATGSRGSWSDLFRRKTTRSRRLEPGAAIWTLVLMFPLYFFASAVLSRTAESGIEVRLIASGVLTLILFGALPMGVLLWKRTTLQSGLQLFRFSGKLWPAVILTGLSVWPLVYELVLLTQKLSVLRIDEERLRQASEFLEKWMNVPLPLMVLTLGILPGVFEELFFRGFLLGSLRHHLRRSHAILLCGLLFGVFHVIASEGVTPERLIPSATLGILLSWIAMQTGSVLPGMVLHVLHNSTLLTMSRFRDELAGMTVGNLQQEHLPASWIIVSATVLLCSMLWIHWVASKSRDGETSRNPGASA
ncbi:MAG: ABC transporter permease subunit/CPBP intramembrane protease [Planctomyces sp.]